MNMEKYDIINLKLVDIFNTKETRLILQEYIRKNVNDFVEFTYAFYKISNKDIFTFPDAVVIDDYETNAAHNYILYYANRLGKIKQLSDDDVEYLKNLKSEKYRK